MANINDSVSKIFKRYLSDRIPNSITNVIWQLANGIDSMFTHLETLIKINKRERNILTALNLSSLRNLAAQNGFEPKFMIPSRGVLQLTINQKMFNKFGLPLYIPPYATFKNTLTGVKYYYDSNLTLKITNLVTPIPVVEGELFSQTHTSQGGYLERIYIDNDSIADGSIIVKVGNTVYQEVKSFADNENVNNNHQFLVKFSNKPNSPIVIYVKGTNQNDIVQISFRLTYGEAGNLDYIGEFEAEVLLDSNGSQIDSGDDIKIKNISGFNFGSNGTNTETLRAAIGYNHGINMLFDTISYTNFVNKYSTLLLSKIDVSTDNKAIKYIYLTKKQYLVPQDNVLIDQYNQIVNMKSYLLSQIESETLSSIIDSHEFALSSHNLYSTPTEKFAIQVMFDTLEDKNNYSSKLENLIYSQFGIFLNNRNHILNLELLFSNFAEENNIKFDYEIFSDKIESLKITNKSQYDTPYILKHIDTIPILKGDFNISDVDYQPVQLFSNINFVIKE